MIKAQTSTQHCSIGFSCDQSVLDDLEDIKPEVHGHWSPSGYPRKSLCVDHCRLYSSRLDVCGSTQDMFQQEWKLMKEGRFDRSGVNCLGCRHPAAEVAGSFSGSQLFDTYRTKNIRQASCFGCLLMSLT